MKHTLENTLQTYNGAYRLFLHAVEAGDLKAAKKMLAIMHELDQEVIEIMSAKNTMGVES